MHVYSALYQRKSQKQNTFSLNCLKSDFYSYYKNKRKQEGKRELLASLTHTPILVTLSLGAQII